MADDFGATLFAEARTHNETARRWFWTAIVALAIFHLMIFQPYLNLANRKIEASQLLRHNQELKKQLDGIQPELVQLNALGPEEGHRRLDDLLLDLRETFGDVNKIIVSLRNMGPLQAEGDAGERLFTAAVQVTPLSMTAQVPIANAAAQAAPLAPHLPAMDAVLRRDIASADSPGRVANLIRPYVEQAIIAPKFAKFNELWHREIAPKVAGISGPLVKKLRVARQQFPDELGTWTGVERSVSDAVSMTNGFSIEPPPHPYWWQTVEGKSETFEILSHALRGATLTNALDDLQRRTIAAIGENKSKQDNLEQELQHLKQEFQDEQQELAEFLKPLKSIAINLDLVVPFFPLILGASIVAVIGSLAARAQQLGEAVVILAKRDPTTLAAEWLRTQLVSSPWHWRNVICIRCLALMAWVALASWQLGRAWPDHRTQAILFAVFGMISIALASSYEWRTVRSLGRSPTGANVQVIAA